MGKHEENGNLDSRDVTRDNFDSSLDLVNESAFLQSVFRRDVLNPDDFQ